MKISDFNRFILFLFHPAINNLSLYIINHMNINPYLPLLFFPGGLLQILMIRQQAPHNKKYIFSKAYFVWAHFIPFFLLQP